MTYDPLVAAAEATGVDPSTLRFTFSFRRYTPRSRVSTAMAKPASDQKNSSDPSPDAFLVTLACFAAIYVVVAAFNTITVSRCKLIDRCRTPACVGG